MHQINRRLLQWAGRVIVGVGLLAALPTLASAAPVAVPDVYSTAVDTPLTMAAPGPLANDFHPEGRPFWIGGMIPTQHGIITEMHADGRFVYVPDPGFRGVDIFYYQITDGSQHAPALTTITLYVGVSQGADLLTNGSFEVADDPAAGRNGARIPSDWRLNSAHPNANANRRVCGGVAQEGVCAFRFRGGQGVTTRLTQIIDPATLPTSLAVGDTLALSVYGRSVQAPGPTRVILRVFYEDPALPRSQAVLRVSHGTVNKWRYYATAPLTLAGAVREARVIVVYQGATGRAWLDNLKLIHNGEAAQPAAPALLPLPPAPDAWVSVPFVL